jgi:hypothetical protein
MLLIINGYLPILTLSMHGIDSWLLNFIARCPPWNRTASIPGVRAPFGEGPSIPAFLPEGEEGDMISEVILSVVNTFKSSHFSTSYIRVTATSPFGERGLPHTCRQPEDSGLLIMRDLASPIQYGKSRELFRKGVLANP